MPDVKLVKQIIHRSYNNNSISINLTTDMWTGQNRQDFLGVTCSFLDKNFILYEFTLTVEHIRYLHNADNISNALFTILNEWNLKEKTHVIVTDNGANIKKAIKDMGSIFPNIKWQLYTTHTLQLIIGKGSRGLNVIKLLVLRVKRLIDFFFTS
ncbi:unnamed protein product [Rhizophagus irregularis]|nr:unnamed protein product [Rhizophagus irregularis]